MLNFVIEPVKLSAMVLQMVLKQIYKAPKVAVLLKCLFEHTY